MAEHAAAPGVVSRTRGEWLRGVLLVGFGLGAVAGVLGAVAHLVAAGVTDKLGIGLPDVGWNGSVIVSASVGFASAVAWGLLTRPRRVQPAGRAGTGGHQGGAQYWAGPADHPGVGTPDPPVTP